MNTETVDIVNDPVGHISISGVHGRVELDERLAKAPAYRPGQHHPVGALLAGVVIGAALVYLVKR